MPAGDGRPACSGARSTPTARVARPSVTTGAGAAEDPVTAGRSGRCAGTRRATSGTDDAGNDDGCCCCLDSVAGAADPAPTPSECERDALPASGDTAPGETDAPRDGLRASAECAGADDLPVAAAARCGPVATGLRGLPAGTCTCGLPAGARTCSESASAEVAPVESASAEVSPADADAATGAGRLAATGDFDAARTAAGAPAAGIRGLSGTDDGSAGDTGRARADDSGRAADRAPTPSGDVTFVPPPAGVSGVSP
jgi:hypothetical protein